MADNGKLVPPYLPYKTLISSLENLSQGIPPRIDRSIWKNQPGTVQSQILSAYRFLGLTLETTEPTDTLRDLVKNRESPTAVLKRIIEEKYKAILAHDLATMTITMLNSEFELAFGVDGETKKKGIRFFLQATKANGFTLSRFLLDQTRATSSTGPRKKRNGKRESDADSGEEIEEEEPKAAKTQDRVITLKSGGQLSLSMSVDLWELSTSDREFVFGLIDSLRKYETENPAIEEDE